MRVIVTIAVLLLITVPTTLHIEQERRTQAALKILLTEPVKADSAHTSRFFKSFTQFFTIRELPGADEGRAISMGGGVLVILGLHGTDNRYVMLDHDGQLLALNQA